MSIQGQGTLVVINTTVADNGTCKHEVSYFGTVETIVVESYHSRRVECAGNPNNFVPALCAELFSTEFQECKVTC